MRVPPVEQADERVGFSGFQFHIISIEVESPGILSRANSRNGSVLRGPVVQADLLIPISVINRSNQNYEPLEERFKISRQEASREVQHRLLAFDFTRMDVGHNEDDGFAGGSRFARIRDGWIGKN